ncbi:hypothetical protein M0812_24282 [Anaeramoeba flamelloides]|uniref:Ribosomal protein S18 n=1 Tax=Anaeramoeba flamelloides TaxID=1746091 RepID=A0AAV7YMT7_9EUKA|nr:hypothetical protein M0812_24282 [Anaeramoeba flamelloides]
MEEIQLVSNPKTNYDSEEEENDSYLSLKPKYFYNQTKNKRNFFQIDRFKTKIVPQLKSDFKISKQAFQSMTGLPQTNTLTKKKKKNQMIFCSQLQTLKQAYPYSGFYQPSTNTKNSPKLL